mmetsp:Transcript_107337/g.308921  ORF Transcript_107337/g.308921 Transcript_107337/m.308921 type:complete len:215 (+) Transcript_107337:875-1519(+)
MRTSATARTIEHRDSDCGAGATRLIAQIVLRLLANLCHGTGHGMLPSLAVFPKKFCNFRWQVFLGEMGQCVSVRPMAVHDTEKDALRADKHEEVVLVWGVGLEAAVAHHADPMAHPSELAVKVDALLLEVWTETIIVGSRGPPHGQHHAGRLQRRRGVLFGGEPCVVLVLRDCVPYALCLRVDCQPSARSCEAANAISPNHFFTLLFRLHDCHG